MFEGVDTNNITNILINHDIDIILGDFNINIYNQNEIQPLATLMESLNYIQIVQSPTFVSSGSLLDHVYVKEANYSNMTIRCSVLPLYYSDHDAVQIAIKNKL